MRRYLYIILFAIVLMTPFVMRQFMVSEAPAAAKSKDRLVIVTPHNQDIRREYARAFSEWHAGRYGQSVAIDYLTPGGTNDIVRLIATTYSGLRGPDKQLPPEQRVRAEIDIVWGGGDVAFDRDLKPLGVLRPIPIAPRLIAAAFPESSLGGVRLYDQTTDAAGRIQPQWIGVCLSSFGIVYNPDLYATLGLPAPQRWQDLDNERLAGLVALADPTHSGSAAATYMMVLQRAMADAEIELFAQVPALQSLPKIQRESDPRYREAIARGWKIGMGRLLLMAANARYFTDSASQVPNDVGNGEAAAGVAIDFYARVYEQQIGSNRMRYVAPAAATAITPDPVAILYGVKGERLTLAVRFVEFLLSPQGQRLWILNPGTPGGPRERSLRRTPIRRDVYADRTGWADDVNPFTESAGFNQRGEWMSLFGETRQIWAAAWIDSREALRQAYARARAAPDAAKRTELIQKLASLPIELRDVEALSTERRQRQKQKLETDEWGARWRIDWANRFRDHYRDIARQAAAWM